MEPAIRPSLVGETIRALNGYYGRLGRIGLDLASALAPGWLRNGAVRLPIDVTPIVDGLRRAADGVTTVSAVMGQRPASPEMGQRPASPETPTILVEADGDRPGLGVFLVENLTAEPVSAPIRVSAFVDERGREVRPRLVLRPAVVSLGPGEQAMVQLAAQLDEALEPGVRYHGEIAIPALSDRRIPVVLRRSPTATVARTRRRRTTASPAEPR